VEPGHEHRGIGASFTRLLVVEEREHLPPPRPDLPTWGQARRASSRTARYARPRVASTPTETASPASCNVRGTFGAPMCKDRPGDVPTSGAARVRSPQVLP